MEFYVYLYLQKYQGKESLVCMNVNDKKYLIIVLADPTFNYAFIHHGVRMAVIGSER